MSEKRSFILNADFAEQFSMLSDEDSGKLIKAIFTYETDGEIPELPPLIALAFSFIRQQLDRND